jgi:O-antigen ligase/Flp pilus assembly protein TadD
MPSKGAKVLKATKASTELASTGLQDTAKEVQSLGSKALVVLWCVWVGLLPWLSGGREMTAVLVSYLALLLGLFLVWRIPGGRSLGKDSLVVGMLGLLAWGGISLLWSVNAYQTIRWLITAALAMAAFLLAYRLQGALVWAWVKGYLIIAGIFSLYGFWLFVAESYERLTSSFFWPNPMAAFLLPAVLVGVWLYAQQGKWLYLLASAISSAALALTYSRGAWILLAVAGFVMMIRQIRQRPGRTFWLRLLLAVILGTAIAAGVLGMRAGRHNQPSQAKIIDPASRLAEVAQQKSVSRDDRVYFVISALQIWANHPIQGTGAGTYASIHPQYQIRVISAARNAHNFYLQTLSELGAVGIGFLVAVLAGLAAGVYRGVKANPEMWPLALGLGVLLLHFAVDINSEYPALWVLAASLGGLLYRPREAKEGVRAGYPVWGLAIMALLLQPTIDLYQSQTRQEWGQISQEEGNLTQAARYFREAHAGIAYDPDTWLAEGISYYSLARQGNNPQLNLQLAQERAQTAAKLDPYDAQHPFLLARTLLFAGDKAGAEVAYRQALQLDPFNNPHYYADLGELYLAQGNLDLAAEVAQRGLSLYTDEVIANRHANVAVRQGVARLEVISAQVGVAKNKLAEAIELLKKAEHHDPQNAAAKQLLVQITGP